MANPRGNPNLPPGKGRTKGSKNKQTLFKEAWKAGLEKAVDKAGGPKAFVEQWLATKQGRNELSNHMLKVCHPLTEKIDVNHKGTVNVRIVKPSDDTGK